MLPRLSQPACRCVGFRWLVAVDLNISWCRCLLSLFLVLIKNSKFVLCNCIIFFYLFRRFNGICDSIECWNRCNNWFYTFNVCCLRKRNVDFYLFSRHTASLIDEFRVKITVRSYKQEGWTVYNEKSVHFVCVNNEHLWPSIRILACTWTWREYVCFINYIINIHGHVHVWKTYQIKCSLVLNLHYEVIDLSSIRPPG